MGFFSSILDLFFPPRCASCKSEGDFLCKKCVQDLRLRPIKSKSVRPSSDDFEYLDGVIYGADYAKNPGLQAALSQFKYKFNRSLTQHFAALIEGKLEALRMFRRRRLALIPVPLHRKRLNYRGFNQAELIANASAARVGHRARVLTPLMRIKDTEQQAKLDRMGRQRNLEGAFSVVADLQELSGKVCFLVDDVCTTGATLDSCAKVLKEHGIRKVYGLVVARAFK